MGFYCVLEGIDGSGKDSQADLLTARLKAQGWNVMRLNEPDDSLPTGKLLRQMLKDGTYVKAHAAMFLADRMALLSEKVGPFLEGERCAVVSVRCFLSTLVYQQENWPVEWLQALHEQLPAKPTHLFLLDLPADVALDRSRRRPGVDEYYERIEVQERNRTRYLDLVTSPVIRRFLAPDATVGIIDASGTHEAVAQSIEDKI